MAVLYYNFQYKKNASVESMKLVMHAAVITQLLCTAAGAAPVYNPQITWLLYV